MRIIFVRHAESVANKNKINAPSDTDLSEKGKTQTKLLAQRLKDEHFEIAYVSPMLRTRKTAEEILKFHKDTKIIIEPEIRERNLGEFTGKKSGTFEKAAEKAGIYIVEFKGESAESIKEMHIRIGNFLNKIIKDDKDVLLVTHGGLITHSFFHFLAIEEKNGREAYPKYHPKNAEISIVEIKNNKAKIISMKENKHLIPSQ